MGDMGTSTPQTPGGERRPNGLLVLFGIVALGFAAGAGYYSYKQPQVEAQLQRELADAPTTPEGRLEMWNAFAGSPNVHHRLTTVARISEERPWIVTHTLAATDGGPPRVFGLDVSDLPAEGILRQEGMTLYLELPAPVEVGRAVLTGDNAEHIPAYERPGDVPDPAARLGELVEWFLADLMGALEREIEGARFEVRIGDRIGGPGAASLPG